MAQECDELGFGGDLAESADSVWSGPALYGSRDHEAVVGWGAAMAQLGASAVRQEGGKVWHLEAESPRESMFFVGTREQVLARVGDVLRRARELAKESAREDEEFPEEGSDFKDMAWAVTRVALNKDRLLEEGRRRFKGMHGKAVMECVSTIRSSDGWKGLLRYRERGFVLTKRCPSEREALRELWAQVRRYGLPA